MKKALTTLILTVAILLVAVSALAVSFYDTSYPLYQVDCYPKGYCYLYSQPDSTYGTNLGKHNNGELLRVLFDNGDGWYYVVFANERQGFVRKTQVTKVREEPLPEEREVYRVYSTYPAGYCYMYDAPSSITGRNLGRYDNGEYIEIVDWWADVDYAYVMGRRTHTYGYIIKTSLVHEDSYKPVQDYAVVNSSNPKGYCYLYDAPSSITGRNLGRYDNGSWVRVINWYADDNYAQVECVSTNKIGYINKQCLERQ